jgi:signal transduction histidine kinase
MVGFRGPGGRRHAITPGPGGSRHRVVYRRTSDPVVPLPNRAARATTGTHGGERSSRYRRGCIGRRAAIELDLRFPVPWEDCDLGRGVRRRGRLAPAARQHAELNSAPPGSARSPRPASCASWQPRSTRWPTRWTRQDKLRRDLVADVAHELRTPVAVLQAGHEALLDGVAEPTPGQLASLRLAHGSGPGGACRDRERPRGVVPGAASCRPPAGSGLLVRVVHRAVAGLPGRAEAGCSG